MIKSDEDFVCRRSGGNTGQHELQPDPVKTSDDLINQVREELNIDRQHRKKPSSSANSNQTNFYEVNSPSELISQMKSQVRQKDEFGSDSEEDDEDAATQKLIEKVGEDCDCDCHY